MLQVAICDDQEIFVKKIRSIVDEYFGKSSVEYKVDVFLSGKEFADLKEKLTKYDIVFLDIPDSVKLTIVLHPFLSAVMPAGT